MEKCLSLKSIGSLIKQRIRLITKYITNVFGRHSAQFNVPKLLCSLKTDPKVTIQVLTNSGEQNDERECYIQLHYGDGLGRSSICTMLHVMGVHLCAEWPWQVFVVALNAHSIVVLRPVGSRLSLVVLIHAHNCTMRKMNRKKIYPNHGNPAQPSTGQASRSCGCLSALFCEPLLRMDFQRNMQTCLTDILAQQWIIINSIKKSIQLLPKVMIHKGVCHEQIGACTDIEQQSEFNQGPYGKLAGKTDDFQSLTQKTRCALYIY